jgi:hypothetical protein
MASASSAPTMSPGFFSPEYSRMQLTTPRSKTAFLAQVIASTNVGDNRAYIATIRSLGTAPCPRCFMKKCDMHMMGSEGDMLARVATRRVDDHARQELVRRAREVVFEDGYAVDSKEMKKILPTSLSMVPVKVNLFTVNSITFAESTSTERLFKAIIAWI